MTVIIAIYLVAIGFGLGVLYGTDRRNRLDAKKERLQKLKDSL